MDIEVYENGEYVHTYYDVECDEEALFAFLCRFCREEGYSLGPIERSSLRECSGSLFHGESISLYGFELVPIL